MKFILKKIIIFSILFPFFHLLQAKKIDIHIGVLANRGIEKTLERWEPMSNYLNASMQEYNISIIALPFEKIESAIVKNKIDFILINSSYYVALEMKYGINRIATLYNQINNTLHLDKFGSVIFTQSNRDDINTLEDIKGKDFGAVDASSFGGWQMGWREFKKLGIDPYEDFSSLRFTHTHDSVVYAVLNGSIDAGTVRTDTLEKMAHEKKSIFKTLKS